METIARLRIEKLLIKSLQELYRTRCIWIEAHGSSEGFDQYWIENQLQLCDKHIDEASEAIYTDIADDIYIKSFTREG